MEGIQSCLQKAHLAYETQNYTKSTFITKAAYNVGGHCINAYDIQSYILGIKSHYSAPEIVDLLIKEEDSISFASQFKKKEYSIGELNEVREEWASCVIDHMLD